MKKHLLLALTVSLFTTNLQAQEEKKEIKGVKEALKHKHKMSIGKVNAAIQHKSTSANQKVNKQVNKVTKEIKPLNGSINNSKVKHQQDLKYTYSKAKNLTIEKSETRKKNTIKTKKVFINKKEKNETLIKQQLINIEKNDKKILLAKQKIKSLKESGRISKQEEKDKLKKIEEIQVKANQIKKLVKTKEAALFQKNIISN